MYIHRNETNQPYEYVCVIYFRYVLLIHKKSTVIKNSNPKTERIVFRITTAARKLNIQAYNDVSLPNYPITFKKTVIHLITQPNDVFFLSYVSS